MQNNETLVKANKEIAKQKNIFLGWALKTIQSSMHDQIFSKVNGLQNC